MRQVVGSQYLDLWFARVIKITSRFVASSCSKRRLMRGQLVIRIGSSEGVVSHKSTCSFNERTAIR